jgi:hypothetical protein
MTATRTLFPSHGSAALMGVSSRGLWWQGSLRAVVILA